jgi:hypothetical protein
MKFDIYRSLGDGDFQKIGTTRFKEDAKAILKNWGEGYIIKNDEVVFKKGTHS